MIEIHPELLSQSRHLTCNITKYDAFVAIARKQSEMRRIREGYVINLAATLVRENHAQLLLVAVIALCLGG